jgi:hypothetical protein
LILGNVIAEGFVSVKKFWPAVVPPRFVLAVPESVAPVPPLATGRVPVTWVDRLTPERVPPRVKFPELVTVPLRVIPFTEPVPPTLVTVPVVLLVPAPMAVLKSLSDSADTVLSALTRRKRIADGLVSVNRFEPTVVAPKLVLAFVFVVAPVPPLAIATVPVTLAAVPVVF